MSSLPAPVPADFAALRARIIEGNASMSGRSRKFAAYALDHPDDIAFGTVASIARAANVQPSTLVRFAQSLGFEGFSSLQILFRDRLRERHPVYTDRLKALQGEASVPPSILLGFVAAAKSSLDRLATGVDLEAFQRAVRVMANARTVYLVAKRRSYPVGVYMAYAFGKFGVRCQLVGTAAGIDEDILALAEPHDAAFAVSFSPYASETVAQARGLARRGVPVVALTDSAFSPLVEPSAEWFELAEADHAGFRLLSASTAFALALAFAVADHRNG